MSSVVLRGLMARTSSGSSSVSTGPTAEESLGTIMVPLLFRVGKGGRMGTGAWMEDCWSSEEVDDECSRSIDGSSGGCVSPILLSQRCIKNVEVEVEVWVG